MDSMSPAPKAATAAINTKTAARSLSPTTTPPTRSLLKPFTRCSAIRAGQTTTSDDSNLLNSERTFVGYLFDRDIFECNPKYVLGSPTLTVGAPSSGRQEPI